MSWTYAELEEFPAEAYLEPLNFATDSDGWPPAGYALEQYEKGRKIATEFTEVAISVKSVWGANRSASGAYLSSYEGIGYHACTCALLAGFLAGPADLVVYRWNPASTLENSEPAILATRFVRQPDGRRVRVQPEPA